MEKTTVTLLETKLFQMIFLSSILPQNELITAQTQTNKKLRQGIQKIFVIATDV